MTRIVSHPDVMSGAYCIAGTRIPVDAITSFISAGDTPEEIQRQYPSLTFEDIEAAVQFARDHKPKPVAIEVTPQMIEAGEAVLDRAFESAGLRPSWTVYSSVRDVYIAMLQASDR